MPEKATQVVRKSVRISVRFRIPKDLFRRILSNVKQALRYENVPFERILRPDATIEDDGFFRSEKEADEMFRYSYVRSTDDSVRTYCVRYPKRRISTS